MSDFDRPLNDRGLKAAPFMGEIIQRKNFLPDIVLSSPAKRAKQTAVAVKEAAGLDGEITYDHRIYEASPQNLRTAVAELAEDNKSAMLVGHNPGIEGFIKYLTGDLQPMPTAALAVINLEIDRWKEIRSDCGVLQTVIRPKDEMKSIGTSTA